MNENLSNTNKNTTSASNKTLSRTRVYECNSLKAQDLLMYFPKIYLPNC